MILKSEDNAPIDEELPDNEIEDVVEEAPSFATDFNAETAEEDVDTENTFDLTPRPKERTTMLRTLRRRLQPHYEKAKRRIQQTKCYKKLMATNRWHWIVGAIAFFSLYDITLFFFGDKSYDIIFPKAEPLDGAFIEEKDKLVKPEIEEYEAPKPKVEKEDEDIDVDGLVPDISETMDEEVYPTSVDAEPATAPTPPKMHDIANPNIAPPSPNAPADGGGN